MRVALTRPQADSEAVAGRIVSIGHEPVIAPVMQIVPIPVDLPASAFEAVIVTSRHALGSLTAMQADRLRGLPAFAVGATSAATARTAGFTDVRIGGEEVVALRDLVRLTLPRAARLLYLAGAVHKPDVPDGLRADGHSLTTLQTYDARPVPWDDATVADLKANHPAVWLHLSRRSVALALDAAERSGIRPQLRAATHACLSSDVADPLHRAGLPLVSVAQRPTLDSLMQVLHLILTQPR